MAHENNKICRVFKALSEPKRYRIVTMLANGKMSASEILKHFNVTQPTLSHDMRLLIDAELVNNQRIGNTVKMTIFLADINEFAVVNKVMTEVMSEPYPARSCFAVAALPKAARVEIEAVVSMQ